MDNIKHGIIHLHTGASVKDSVQDVNAVCKRAKELGAPAVVLTDHGVLSNVFSFMKAAKEENIKGIPGVEAYVQEDGALSKRGHLILIPKNLTGYKAICRAVTESNKRFDSVPRMNLAILERYFGKNSKGHDNVFATSACMAGVLAQVLMKNSTIDNEIEKLEKRLEKLSDPNDVAYLSDMEKLEKIHDLIMELVEKRDIIAKIANKKFEAKERRVNVLKEKDEEKYQTEKEKLENEIKESKEAAKELTQIKSEIAKLKKKETVIKKHCAEAKKTHGTWREINQKIKDLSNSRKSDKELFDEAVEEAKKYINIFGNDNFYIELQYHGVPEEKGIMQNMLLIANKLNLPIVACNDAHITNNTPKDIRARQIANSLRFNKFEPLREGDSELYIKTDEELKNSLSKIFDNETVDRAMLGIKSIIKNCNVEFSKETHFPKFISEDGESASDRLCRLAKEGIEWRFKGEWTEIHQKRMEYELEIIEGQGYCDYLCIVEDFLRYGRIKGLDNPEKVGLGVGPGRGSAVGSLVCYLIGITSIDPIKYGLLFERFLNPNRVSYPDIDSDFGMEVRKEVLEYVKKKYGEAAVCNIMTKGTFAARAAIRNVARIHGDEKYGDIKSLLNLGDAIAKAIPATPGIKLKDVMSELEEKFKINEEDVKKVQQEKRDAMDIIHDATLIEGALSNYGMHAAGVIIADNGDVGEYVPLMYNEKKKQWVCQCTMTEAEEDAGLLKFDFLGLENLDIITDTLRLVKRNKGIDIDIEEVGRSLVNGRTTKFDIRGNVFDDIFAKGNTNAVFQFESSGMKSMLKRFKPSNINDIILLVACYRPGPMQYLEDIIKIKYGLKKPTYIVPDMEEILGNTYGHPVYQESVMEICNKIAGFSLDEADIIRQAMSKKKDKILAKYHDPFVNGFIKAGATKEASEKFWEELLEFSKYAFNKSHACAYAFVAYYTAWLKLNYPVEYMTAVLNHTDTKKYPMIVTDCKNMGINVLPPDINDSELGFSCRNGEILFGIGNIKGVKNGGIGIIEQRDKANFTSFRDYIVRGHSRKDVTEVLIDVGAMDKWCSNRAAMKYAVEGMYSDYKKSIEKLEIIKIEEDAIKSITDEKELKKKQKKIDNAKQKYDEYIGRFNHAVLPVTYIHENILEKLELEKELLGMYVSGHPLDEYDDVKKNRTSVIADATVGVFTLSGIVKNLKKTFTKKDNKEIAFFTLEDESGSIDVNCFSATFEEYGNLIEEGAVISIEGTIREEEEFIGNNDGDNNDEDIVNLVYKITAKKINKINRNRCEIMISVKDVMDWTDRIYPKIKVYSGNDYSVVVHDKMTGNLRRVTDYFSADLLYADIDGCEIKMLNDKKCV